jgi:chromosome partitioning protein
VGKTAVAVHAAAVLGAQGKRVVLVDLDSQANATSILSTEEDLAKPSSTTAEVLLGQATMKGILRPSTAPGVQLAPASGRLTAAQVRLNDKIGRELVLRKALAGLEADVVVIDTGPDGHWAVANALVAASHVVIPFTTDTAAIHGLLATEALVEDAKALNEGLSVAGLLQIAYDRRMALTDELREQVKKQRGRLLLDVPIRANARFNSTVGLHKTVFELEKGASEKKGTEDYQNAVASLMGRIRKGRAAA